jgi:hypothetical protein
MDPDVAAMVRARGDRRGDHLVDHRDVFTSEDSARSRWVSVPRRQTLAQPRRAAFTHRRRWFGSEAMDAAAPIRRLCSRATVTDHLGARRAGHEVDRRGGVEPLGIVRRVRSAGDGENDSGWSASVRRSPWARREAIAAARFVAGDFAEEGAAVFLEEVLRQIRKPVA